MHILILGIGTAALSSVMFNLGMVLWKEGALELPKIRRPDWSTIKGFLMAKLWMIGTAVTLGGYVFEFISFATAPFVLVQPVFSAGVVSLAFFSVVIAHERLDAVEWLGICMAIVGALMVGLSANPGIDRVSREHVVPGRPVIALACVGLLAVLTNLIAARLDRHKEVLFGLSAGLAFTGSEMLTKGVGLEFGHRVGRGAGSVLTPRIIIGVILLIGFGLLGTYLLQIGFQHGRALVVGGVMGISADILPIMSGLLIFGEKMPKAPFFFWMRLLGIVGAVMGAVVITFRPSTEHLIEQLEHGELGPYAHHDDESAVTAAPEARSTDGGST